MRHKDLAGVVCFGAALFALGYGVTYAVGVLVVEKSWKKLSLKT